MSTEQGRQDSWPTPLYTPHRHQAYFATHCQMPSFIVGRRGSGKTTLLRRLRLNDSNSHPVANGPESHTLNYISDLVDNIGSPSTWGVVWDRALLCAAYSHLPTSSQAPMRLNPALAQLSDYLPAQPVDPFAALDRLVRVQRTQSHLARLLGESAWELLRCTIGSVATGSLPHFLMDSIGDIRHGDTYDLPAAQNGLIEAVNYWRNSGIISLQLTLACSAETVAPLLFSHNSMRDHTLFLEWSDLDLEILARRFAAARRPAWVSSDFWSISFRSALLVSTHVPSDILSLLHRLGAESAEEATMHLARSTTNRLFRAAAAEVYAMYVRQSDGRSALLGAPVPSMSSQLPREQLEGILRAMTGPEGLVGVHELESASFRAFGVNVIDVLWRNGVLGIRDGDRLEFYSPIMVAHDLTRAPNQLFIHPALSATFSESMPSDLNRSISYGGGA